MVTHVAPGPLCRHEEALSTRRHRRRAAAAVILALVALLVPAAPASAAAFTDATPIVFPSSGFAREALPYPSTIAVSGLSGVVVDVDVTLHDVHHTYPSDMHVLLVGPTGANLVVMADAGLGDDLTGLTVVLDDEAPAELPEHLPAAGTVRYQPEDLFAIDPLFSFPAPSPSAARELAVFDGTDPNGTWSLFGADDTPPEDGGSIAGWTLEITTALPPAAGDCSQPTLRGTAGDDRLVGTPGNDVIDAGAGADLVTGLAGNDTLCGAGGADLLDGGDGADHLRGGRGDDTLLGGDHDDRLAGGGGLDHCDGGGGVDRATLACEWATGAP